MGSSAKNSRKDGKYRKTLTAEEEAKRRKEMAEWLREKYELDRRALKVVERLLEDSVSEDFLVDCARFITAANYKDAIEERFISKLCGYPICPNKLGKIPTQQYKISTKTNKVYDLTERKCFCCNFCYKASKTFELQISKTPLWLRPTESPATIKLLKKGDGGGCGEEVMLKERRLKVEDIENPTAAQTEDSHRSPPSVGDEGQSDSDREQEQDFVSSMVDQQQRPRVHWGPLPSGPAEDQKVEQGQTERGKKQVSLVSQTDHKPDSDLEEVGARISECRISEEAAHAPMHADSPPTEAGRTADPPTEIKNPASETLQASKKDSASPNQQAFSITQVGMSRRGAAGLQGLLKKHTERARPQSLRQRLIEHLKGTLNDWRTDETLRFLYGDARPPGSPFADVQEEEEEELDEDDLEDEPPAVDARRSKSPSAAAPDYDTLRRETEHLELRVREFYQGRCILPEEVTVQEQRERRDPSLPLSDSQAQRLIQKKIAVEKLSSCLKNIVGPLRLAMSDVSSHLNNLVRTFRLTNTNIIHRTPEWTLIAVILLHLLSDVSPVLREALQTSASVEYLNTLMEELGLQEQDLLNLVQLFRSQ
ncbi:putative RNA polymerase II subunit B1 CTD phosphatase rpap2 [Salarias fasciatus]|uniref:RNA polymerase II subunit B1 CTD phosphatase RPAP2 homolog n=1 Tax=Salarias fasciatus TaxID=181472 RepID=A0A672J7Y2_SALFA|nr:putative RNA polymerase II subunit B1 CTD phosphatase RPAP2 [Salarias fasciatus]